MYFRIMYRHALNFLIIEAWSINWNYSFLREHMICILQIFDVWFVRSGRAIRLGILLIFFQA